MQCPKCEQAMQLMREDVSENAQNAKKYDRKVFHCSADDIWISLEVPKE